MKDYKLIEKEKIDGLSFPVHEVLSDPKEIKERAVKIHKATSLGNMESVKVYILFKEKNGLKKIFTTLWAQTSKKIILKKGLSIPVNRIVDIRFA